ncbi:hypothetical protein CKO28_06240 [Rhodovibrio sodomensis]|uniref:Polymerase nucleotidyl transferase domain-containing protein n=1 Tax=Rhodovibrio sodomensis TaxID=1088 RepID=A0ABS1DB04_9PROT|nr:hypothetical protein [Rhodovibrio sodomensis]MBK1667632.1 hypothetical protein [Rhodovibrio sodomensis]
MPGEKIAGIRVSRIKAALRESRRYITSAELGYRLGLLEPSLSRVCGELADRGIIQFDETYVGVDQWEIGPAGQRLLASPIQKPMSRDQARDLLAQTIERGQAINADAGLAFRVTEIVVFGSYITNAEDLGDLDIGVRLDRRRNPAGRDLMEEASARAPASLGPFRHGWGQQEVLKALTVDEKRVSLHGIDEVERMGARHQVVYGLDPVTGSENKLPGDVRCPTPEQGVGNDGGGAAAARSNACTDPAPPPYDPAAAPRRPRRIAASARRDSRASESEIAVQHAWANGLTPEEIIEQQHIEHQSPRSLRDLIAALYAWHDDPDRSVLPPNCSHVCDDAWWDPAIDGLRLQDGRAWPIQKQLGRAGYRWPRDCREIGRPRNLETLDQAIARVLGDAADRVCVRVRAEPPAAKGANWRLDFEVREDSNEGILFATNRRAPNGRLTYAQAVNDAWKELGASLNKGLVDWCERLHAALDGTPFLMRHWVDGDRLAAARDDGPIPTGALRTAVLYQGLRNAVTLYPNVLKKVCAGEVLAAIAPVTGVGVRFLALRPETRVEDSLNPGVGHAALSICLEPDLQSWRARLPERFLAIGDLKIVITLDPEDLRKEVGQKGANRSGGKAPPSSVT